MAPTEVVFDRICRHNGIEHLLTKIRCSCSAGARSTLEKVAEDVTTHGIRPPAVVVIGPVVDLRTS